MLIQWENNGYTDKLQAHSFLRVIHTKVTVILLRKQDNQVEFVQIILILTTFKNSLTPIVFQPLNCEIAI